MDDATRLLFEQLGISLLLGLLVGLQRQHADSAIAGLRTFALVSVLGSLAAMLDRHVEAGGWVLAAAFLSVAAVTLVSNFNRFRREEPDYGMTTEVALLLMFAIGAYLVFGHRIVAVAVGGGLAVLLQFKPELHGLASRLGDGDLRAIMQFVLITCVILPILPNETYDPLDVLNPFEIWLMVVLMVGISLGGYLIYKFFGRTAGILLGGVLGGAISSTATTLSYAKRARANPSSAQLATVVVVIASTMVYGRVLLEISVVAPAHFARLAPPVVVMMLATLVSAGVAWLLSRGESDEMPPQTNPAELKSALVFGVLFVIVLFALAATQNYFSGSGMFVVAALSGLTDMDAITLSAARMVQMGPDAGGLPATQGWQLIVVAAMSNLVFKAGIAGVVGTRQLLARTIAGFSLPFLVGIALLIFWPMVEPHLPATWSW